MANGKPTTYGDESWHVYKVGKKRWLIRFVRTPTEFLPRGYAGVAMWKPKGLPKGWGLIEISSRLKMWSRTETLMHEVIHAAIPAATEKEVERASRALMDVMVGEEIIKP